MICLTACGFRDAIDKLKKAGVVVLGISRDTVKAQKKFAEAGATVEIK